MDRIRGGAAAQTPCPTERETRPCLLNLVYYSDTFAGARISRVPRPVPPSQGAKAPSFGASATRPAVPAAGVEPEHTGLRALRRPPARRGLWPGGRPQSTRRDKPRRGTRCLRNLVLPIWLSL